jgi:hypothetical protein
MESKFLLGRRLWLDVAAHPSRGKNRQSKSDDDFSPAFNGKS